ncbi:endo-1,4-beta-xylanase [Puniceicoccales bacterium CK1056]|uniref:endo-1,4-beta-xylanase n=1 Tax=Oceanipulchritudo coccoides TaxID=2706888 RepID=A0A6B2M5P7_9BACT|nr:endo-1,4-beta-xylanase [Oceanipulchritudo coccoides]NDV63552.1 endo-1,4-beta-xylanase [Oceanipulchritudo coccoides]
MESDLGIRLSAEEILELGSIVKPDGQKPQWRRDAEQRIETHRRADLAIEVLDRNGMPVSGAVVEVKLLSNGFNFGGVLGLRDMFNETGNLRITTERYQSLALKMFNTAGLNNGLKPKLRNGNEYLLPGFFEWAQANDLPVRGHLLIWPGNTGNNHLPADILSDVEDVEAAIANGETPGTVDALKAILKANIDAMITDWASKWPVYEWDVINEPRGNFRVQDLLGYGEMAEWFKIAETEAVLPGCEFFLNENQIISAKSESLDFDYYTTRRDIYKASVDRIISDGGPISGLGFQSRFKWEHIDPGIIYDRLEEFSQAYGLEMAGTEFEIKENDRAGFYPDEQLRAQMTEEIMTAFYSHPMVTGLNAWTYMSDDSSALCDYDGSVKLNGLVWYYLNRIRYYTESIQSTDTSGRIELRGNKGEYEVTVRNGEEVTVSRFNLDSSKTMQVHLSSDTGASMWGSFPLLLDEYVDSGSWLGLLHVRTAPWIWSFSLSSWLYVPGITAMDGMGWVFVPIP